MVGRGGKPKCELPDRAPQLTFCALGAHWWLHSDTYLEHVPPSLRTTAPCVSSNPPFFSPCACNMWQENNNNAFGASSSQNQYYGAPPAQGVPLQFYAPSPVSSTFYSGSRPSLDGNVGAQGSINSQGIPPGYGGNIQPAGGWWTAFGTGGFEGEPPLLEGAYTDRRVRACASQRLCLELGFNFAHIRAKTLTVLNPFSRVDERIMDDADLAGPLLFFLCFGTFLLMVRTSVPTPPMPVSHALSVREAAVWLHLRSRPHGFCVYLHASQPDGRERHRRVSRRVGSGLLPIAYGRCFSAERGLDSGVSTSAMDIVNVLRASSVADH